MFLEILQNSQEKTHVPVSFLIMFQTEPGSNFIKKETLAQVFSCEFCKISKNTFSMEHIRATAPDKLGEVNFLPESKTWSNNRSKYSKHLIIVFQNESKLVRHS